MHVAKLVVITEAANVPPETRPFVEFRAAVEDRTLEDKELVAVLVIDTTTSYIPVFLKGRPSMAELEGTLKAQDAVLAADTKAALARHMGP